MAINPGLAMMTDGGGPDETTIKAQIDALSKAVTTIVAQSTDVLNSPKGQTPDTNAVTAIVDQVTKAIAPVVAPNITPQMIAQLGPAVMNAITSSPAIKAADTGATITPAQIDKIASAASLGLGDVQNERRLNQPAATAAATPAVTPDVTPAATPDVVTPTRTPDPQPGVPHVPYAQLTAAERAAMTPEQQLAYIRADDIARTSSAAIERTSDPTTDFTNRPVAPTSKDGMMFYYGWVGGATSGKWTLYSAPDTADNQAKYGALQFGGKTQATATDITGANSLTVQPQFDSKTGTYSAVAGSGAIAPAVTPPPPPGGVTPPPPPGGVTPPPPPGGVTPPVTPAVTPPPPPGGTNSLPAPDTATKNALALLSSTLAGYKIENSATGAPLSTAILGLLQANYDAPTIQALIQDPGSVNSTDPNVKALATAWNTRFAGNVQRIANGQNPLSPADYIATENSYQDISKAAGLPAGFISSQMPNLIANNIAPTELQDRVNVAAKSIANQDPFYTNTLQQYYGLSSGDMIAHALDPQTALPLLQRQAATATFGAAGARQNIGVDQNTAAQYAALNITQGQAEHGFQSVAQALPTEQKLAAIYGGNNTQFGSVGQQQGNLIAATFGGAGGAQSEAQIKKLQQQEVSAFSGSSGVDKNSLFGSTAGSY